MTTSDEALALAAANGDSSAFGLLLDRHYDRLFGLCFRLTGQRAEAEDLTQDICAALPAKLSSYKAKSKVTTWLYRVAVNAAHDRRRRRATYARHSAGWGDWEQARQAEMAEAAEHIDWLHSAMAHLSDDLRDTLALILDDVTHAEAAQILGVSEGTISWRMSEAKKRLRALKAEEETR
ncbi:RNA polymerase sigma factor [Flavimaricola marinus]|nr:RNA polymerase sigma factor [Flavimaricola marinus]